MPLFESYGIIGTACRRGEDVKLGKVGYLRAVHLIEDILGDFHGELVSGGAAFMDHVAVLLYLKNPEKYSLTLHLPTNWDFSSASFAILESDKGNCGFTSNMYHEGFSRIMGFDSLVHIHDAISFGATVKVGKGFFDRNTAIAETSTNMISATFGRENILADGGTADTMRKFLRKNSGNSHHIDLNTFRAYTPARTL